MKMTGDLFLLRTRRGLSPKPRASEAQPWALLYDPERVLMNDQYCQECPEDSHASWASSVHRFASFNNPAYLFSVRERTAVRPYGGIEPR